MNVSMNFPALTFRAPSKTTPRSSAGHSESAAPTQTVFERPNLLGRVDPERRNKPKRLEIKHVSRRDGTEPVG